MPTTYLVAFDVGGTNTRVAAACLSGNGLEEHPHLPEPESRPVADRSDLQAFVGEVVDRLSLADDHRLGGAALACAGPVRDGVARMTNWPEPREISLSDLADWGLLRETTALLNDVEAGAHGLLEVLGADRGTEGRIVPLRVPDRVSGPGDGNMVLVTPGTGLGCAGLLRLPDEDGWLPVASETGHAPIAALDARHAELIESLRDTAAPGSPTWEDFISGRGLVMMYRHWAPPRGPADDSPLDGDDPAGAIAEAAVAGRDEGSVRTLEFYYRCVGRFAQVLALTVKAGGGVFLAGGSTRKNRAFIEGSGLVDEFLANPTQRELLESFSIYMVLDEVNLKGALAVARRLARGG